MSEPLNPGAHPDADSLSAFLEGTLPKHERQSCLAHFAQCAACREVVFLAQAPAPVPAAPQPAPAWRRWWAPVAVLSGVAACAAVTVAIFSPPKPVAPTQAIILNAPPAAASAQARAEKPPLAFHSAEGEAKPRRKAPSIAAAPAPVTAAVPVPPPMMERHAAPLPAAAPVPAPSRRAAGADSSALPVADPLHLSVQHDSVTIDGLPVVDGSVTDPAGAGIAGATVTLAQAGGAASENVRTDARGKFAIPDVPVGKYELSIVAPGFRTASGEIELQAKDRATVAPVLPIGTVTETVEVSAGAQLATVAPQATNASVASQSLPMAQRMSAARLLQPIAAMPAGANPLPSKLAAATCVVSGKLLLAADAAGALYLSSNAGKSWKAVKSVWPGKLVSLANSRGGFQLTTDAGSIWLSQDGLHWMQAPAQH